MASDNPVQDEESRTISHLEYLGYTVDPTVEPRGWRFAASALAHPLTFRVSERLVFLYAEYPAGRCRPETSHRLLEGVNGLNAENWFVRLAVEKKLDRAAEKCVIRLRAHVPTGLPTTELGGYLVAWIRESTLADRLARAFQSEEDESDGSESEQDDV